MTINRKKIEELKGRYRTPTECEELESRIELEMIYEQLLNVYKL